MSERKVLNKYYPIDFDPSKIPKRKGAKKDQQVVRMMVPFTLRCTHCGNFIYKGTKFNSRKETVVGEDYLGIKIYRFYMRCSRCSQEITIKTDPKNADYVAELGCTRNFEIWKERDKTEEELRALRAEEDQDAMKRLENRTMDSKREMDILDALEGVQQINARNSKVNPDELLSVLEQREEAKKAQQNTDVDSEFANADGIDKEDLLALEAMETADKYVRRLDEEDENDPFVRLQRKLAMTQQQQQQQKTEQASTPGEFKAPQPKRPTVRKNLITVAEEEFE